MKCNFTIDKIGILMILAFLCSCQNATKVEETPQIESETPTETVVEVPVNNQFTFLENIPERKFPLIDSTNFNNFSSNKILNQNQLDLIQIKKIAENPENVVAHYQIKLSKNFKTFVFTYNRGEMELFSTLVNYDNDYHFVSKLDISYDETAESWFRTESEINGNQIIVNEMNYTEETEKTTKTVYKIQENGVISKK